MDLPESVTSKIKHDTIEQFALPLLRKELEGVPIWSLLPPKAPTFGVLVRKDLSNGADKGDPRGFTEVAVLQIDCFTKDPDGDLAGAQLSEAVAIVFRDAWLNQTVINGSWITNYRLVAEPARKADFADSAGPVQYADLPQRVWRYQLKVKLVRFFDQS